MEDVVIVGGGPAGNETALALARAGYKVTVVDYRRQLGDKLCTGIVSVECLRDFPAESPVVHRSTRAAVIVAPSGRKLHLEKQAPQACIIDRVAYVGGIARQAQAAGATYLLGRGVADVCRLPDRVELALDRRGEIRRLEARVVVIASGFRSPLAGRLGMGRVGDCALAAQVEVLAPSVEEIEIYLGKHVAPGFFAWLVPTHSGRALLGLLSRAGAGDHLQRLRDSLEKSGKVGGAMGPVRRWGIPLRPLENTASERAVVVGDAAGQVKPTTGGGIYYALMSGRIAAEAIDRALRAGHLGAESLFSYDREWRALLGGELEAGRRIRALAERLGDWHLDRIISIVGSNGFLRELLTSSDVSFDWHGRLAQKVLGFPMLVDSMKLLGFSDLWRRLTRDRN